MENFITFKYISAALVYSFIGLIVLTIAFFLFDKFTPGNFWKEIIEEQNVALAIMMGSVVMAVAHIIASAIHG